MAPVIFGRFTKFAVGRDWPLCRILTVGVRRTNTYIYPLPSLPSVFPIYPSSIPIFHHLPSSRHCFTIIYLLSCPIIFPHSAFYILLRNDFMISSFITSSFILSLPSSSIYLPRSSTIFLSCFPHLYLLSCPFIPFHSSVIYFL